MSAGAVFGMMLIRKMKADPDSQFRLLGCKWCKGHDVAYRASGKRWQVKCFTCGLRTGWHGCQHEAQIAWNRDFGEGWR